MKHCFPVACVCRRIDLRPPYDEEVAVDRSHESVLALLNEAVIRGSVLMVDLTAASLHQAETQIAPFPDCSRPPC